MARHIGRLHLGEKLAKFYGRLSILPLSQRSTYVSSGIIRHYVVAFVSLHFALSYTTVLNSLEELCIIVVGRHTGYPVVEMADSISTKVKEHPELII